MLYMYRCPACESERDIIVPTLVNAQYLMNNPPPCHEPGCNTLMNRVLTPAAIHFKGSGWTPKGAQ